MATETIKILLLVSSLLLKQEQRLLLSVYKHLEVTDTSMNMNVADLLETPNFMKLGEELLKSDDG